MHELTRRVRFSLSPARLGGVADASDDLAVGAFYVPRIRSLEQLGREPNLKTVVLRAGCSYRQRLEEILAARGIVGLRHLEFGTVEAIVGCVAGSLGVTLMPHGIMAAAEAAGRVRLHALAPDEGQVDTLFIRRQDAYVSSAHAAFLECARPALNAAAVAL